MLFLSAAIYRLIVVEGFKTLSKFGLCCVEGIANTSKHCGRDGKTNRFTEENFSCPRC